jgi:hypothetical protein
MVGVSSVSRAPQRSHWSCEYDRAQIAKLATKTPVTQAKKRRLLDVEHAVGDTEHVFGVEFVFHCTDDVGVGCG